MMKGTRLINIWGGGMVMEYIKAEYRRLVKLLCEKYNKILAQDIFKKANNRTSDKENEKNEKNINK